MIQNTLSYHYTKETTNIQNNIVILNYFFNVIFSSSGSVKLFLNHNGLFFENVLHTMLLVYDMCAFKLEI